MMDTNKSLPLPSPGTIAGWRAPLETTLVFLVFFLHGAWPVPDSNEPHYLVKALHYWNPQAFAGDFFCESADAHAVFYWTVGWLTLWFPLSVVAWIGRSVTWLLLAVAFRQLSWAMVPRPWLAVLAAALFALLTEQAHMAGEWIIGGVEAKGFAYALVLFALHAIYAGRWNAAWLLFGAATSMHVLVGGWSLLIAVGVWLATPRREAPWPRLWIIALTVALMTPGIWAVVKIKFGVDSEVRAEANAIQVFDRLKHHVLPSAFAAGFIARHTILWVLFFVWCAVTPASSGDRRFRWFVVGTMALSLIGFAIAALEKAQPEFVAAMLRFYWFRLSDILVPLGVALVGMQFWAQLLPNKRRFALAGLAAMIAVLMHDGWRQVQHLPAPINPLGKNVTPRADKFMAFDDWLDVCEWIKKNTPADAVILSPRNAGTLKWRTGRKEAATWKDMPQDANSLVRWWRQYEFLHATGKSNPEDRYYGTLAEVGDGQLWLRLSFAGADYVIVKLHPDVPALKTKPVHKNKSYAIYLYEDLPSLL